MNYTAITLSIDFSAKNSRHVSNLYSQVFQYRKLSRIYAHYPNIDLQDGGQKKKRKKNDKRKIKREQR